VLGFISKKPDEKSLLCLGKLRIYSHIVSTPIRVMGISLRQTRHLIELYDEFSDVLRKYSTFAPIVEIDVDVRKEIFEKFSKTLEKYSDYMYEIRKKFQSHIFLIPFFSATISRKVVEELSTSKTSYSLSIFLSHYVGQDHINILSIPVLKTQMYDTEVRKKVQIVNAKQYVEYVKYAVKYFEERINKPFFIPFAKIPDRELPTILNYLIGNEYTNILLDYDGSSYKKLTDLIRLLQIEYDRKGMLNKLILYGTRILREAVSKRTDEEVKFADILAFAGLDILGSNYKKRIIVEEERPIYGRQETVERFFNNKTYGYRHEELLANTYTDIAEIVQEILERKHGQTLKKLIFKIINTNNHRKEAEKYIEIVTKNKELQTYLNTKKYVKKEDLETIKRKPSEHKLDEYL